MDVADNPSGLHPTLVALTRWWRGGDLWISHRKWLFCLWAYKLGMSFDTIRSEFSLIHAFPFNSEKKRGGVAVLQGDSEVFIHWKGAAEIVLACCTLNVDSNETHGVN